METTTRKFCSIQQQRESLYILLPSEWVKLANVRKGDYLEAMFGTGARYFICFRRVKGDEREVLERALEVQSE